MSSTGRHLQAQKATIPSVEAGFSELFPFFVWQCQALSSTIKQAFFMAIFKVLPELEMVLFKNTTGVYVCWIDFGPGYQNYIDKDICDQGIYVGCLGHARCCRTPRVIGRKNSSFLIIVLQASFLFQTDMQAVCSDNEWQQCQSIIDSGFASGRNENCGTNRKGQQNAAPDDIEFVHSVLPILALGVHGEATSTLLGL